MHLDKELHNNNYKQMLDAARTAAYEPQQRLQQYGGGLGQLAGFASPAPPIHRWC